jgi:hypothetical protein
MQNSYYEDGNLALPGGHGSLILENVTFAGRLSVECSHHCGVGVTGVLCMPTYVLLNPVWLVPADATRSFIQWGANQGAMFTLAPPHVGTQNAQGLMFPKGYVSLVHPAWTYLQALDGGQTCHNASYAARLSGVSDVTTFARNWGQGLLCRRPVRRLEVYSFGQTLASNPPNLQLSLWQGGVQISAATILYFQIGDDASRTRKQGYATTVIPGTRPHHLLLLLVWSCLVRSIHVICAVSCAVSTSLFHRSHTLVRSDVL